MAFQEFGEILKLLFTRCNYIIDQLNQNQVLCIFVGVNVPEITLILKHFLRLKAIFLTIEENQVLTTTGSQSN